MKINEENELELTFFRSWQVYILRCTDDSLYTGITTNLAKRMAEHQSGRGAAYTRSHPPKTIVYHQTFSTRSQALKTEAWIKSLTRAQKKSLVGGTISSVF